MNWGQATSRHRPCQECHGPEPPAGRDWERRRDVRSGIMLVEMGAARFVNVFIEPNPNCPEGCSQRFQATSESRLVKLIRYSPGGDETILCDVAGWSSAADGTPCPARAVSVEDSGAGVATLV